MAQSPNLALPYISAAQAQKHVTHNEAIATLDTLVQLTVISASQTAPPPAPAEGVRYIVPVGASGDWAGHANAIVQREIGGWRIVPAVTGLRAWIEDQSTLAVFDGAEWVDFRSYLNGFAQLGVNAAADTTNRLAVSSPASLFNHEGGSHRMVINKQATGDTASLVFQDGFSGRAEFGLAGSDAFAVKVSADGASWHEAMRCAPATGVARFPSGVESPGIPLRILSSILGAGFTTTLATPQATGLAVTLTPRSSASKMLVRCHLTLGGYLWTNSPLVTVVRNGTKIWPAASGVSLSHQTIVGTLTNTRSLTYSASFEFMDEPASTAPVTYQVMLASSVAGANVHLNLRDVDLALRGESSMFVTEISG